jgi:perosamine synthetase
MGKFGAFSFHGTKTITTGEGGMFVTNDADLYERVLTLSNHGRSTKQSKQFWPDIVGFKFKMSNIQAAIGCAQMERIDHLVQRKRQFLSYYREQLKELAEIAINPEPDGTINGAWMPTVVFSEKSGIKIEKIQSAFNAKNIDARVFFWPLSSLPMFTSQYKNPVAQSIQNRSVNLPSYHDITLSEQDRVIKVVTELLSKREGSKE